MISITDIRDAIGNFVRDDVDNSAYLNLYDEYVPTDGTEPTQGATLAPPIENGDPDEWRAMWHYVAKAVVEEIRSDFSADIRVARSGSNQSLGTAPGSGTVEFNSTVLVDSGVYSRSGGVITVNEAGRYRLSGAVTAKESSSPPTVDEKRLQLYAQIDDGGGWVTDTVAITGSWRELQTKSIHFQPALLDLAAGDKIRMFYYQKSGPDLQIVDDQSSMIVEKYE